MFSCNSAVGRATESAGSPTFDLFFEGGWSETDVMESSYKSDFRQPLASQRSVSSEGSRRSKASQKSVGRYKRTEGGVDESLFSASKTEKERGFSAPAATKDRKPAKVEMDSIVLTTSDLHRIRRAAAPVGQFDDSADTSKQELEAAKTKARERKQRMLAMEEQRRAKLEKTDLELEDEHRSKEVVSNAEHAREETLDAVKHMNSQVNRGDQALLSSPSHHPTAADALRKVRDDPRRAAPREADHPQGADRRGEGHLPVLTSPRI